MKKIIISFSLAAFAFVLSIGGLAAANASAEGSHGTLLFETDKYRAWQWYNGPYPSDMSFKASAACEETAGSGTGCQTPKLRLFAQLGVERTGGYGIGIEKVALEDGIITVVIHTKSPAPGQFVTKALNNPSDTVLVDLNGVSLPQELSVRWVDQQGKLLYPGTLNFQPVRQP